MGDPDTLKQSIERSVAVLKGKALWRCLRAADMATFAFGERRRTLDWQGKPREVGEWALHVQCAWRISCDGRVVIGDGDLYYPADYRRGELIPDEFDWEQQPNLRDALLDSFFEQGRRAYLVSSIDVGDAGRLYLALTDGFSLEIFPNNSASDEYWRLFQPDQNLRHFVVTNAGAET